MERFGSLMGRRVELKLGGLAAAIEGTVAGWGQDILVLFNGYRYIYVPFRHVEQLAPGTYETETKIDAAEPVYSKEGAIHGNQPSCRKILTAARGVFSEIYFASGRPVHGYVSSVMNDYFIFCTPVHHTVAVSLQHLKYMSPYAPDASAPYNLSPGKLAPRPSPVTLARTFNVQLRKLEGELIVLNMGLLPSDTGVLAAAGEQMLELTGEAGGRSFIAYEQVQSVHVP
ncbi:DUF2642 domain-containing protein [Paenibacillus sp. GCM10012307]|uniref:DUF2642 domain-containing protein n=1 Tax=Paenibacillus roseus TaxID=2798579 RepID=A0A934JB84_9BACL|nr:DUF2642 domain-containing protein [Paenibacillus roseus]MBJ6363862.1 DUF2642 domain-containing protein [Paenibacillus roseus]